MRYHLTMNASAKVINWRSVYVCFYVVRRIRMDASHIVDDYIVDRKMP